MKLKSYLLILFLCSSMMISSQTKKGIGGEIGLYESEYGSFMGETTLTYNWLTGRNFSFSLGGMLIYTKTDDIPGWETDNAFYSFDEDKRLSFNIVTSATYMLPVFGHIGIFGTASAYFQPVPLSYISLDKATKTDPIVESKGKYAFNGFAPGAFGDLGFYYDIIRNDHILKLFLGFGYGWYDPLSDYRNNKIDGQELSTRIPDKKNHYRITFKFTGFK